MTDLTLSSASPSSSTRAGVLLMLLSIMMFALNDVLGKWLVSTYSAPQLILIRSVAAVAVLLPFFWRSGWRKLVSVERPLLQALRALLCAVEATAFYYVVGHMPLADTITYWLAAPIYVAALSPLMLGEKVGWRRWTAILVGFAGVVVALEPSAASFTLPALVALAGSFAFTFTMIFARSLRGTPDTTLAFWQMAVAVVFSVVAIGIDPTGWIPVRPVDFGLLALLGVVAMSAHMLVNRSLKLADAATIVPLNYTMLVWGILLGWLFFGDVPRGAMLVGAVLIVASGLFIFFREQKLKQADRR
ncbi:DMT family transporter [Mycoplana dimorpha]|uniref:EamA domain-containing membrane protein RarD n=1 Tax=Mycoplana dimorpha TaxID=28320 RepID=A0A2T5B313_MYCDI|nr:DMT family transporter [Mycoplana dimorpha]PTM93377.1 EamA domain-containing membrane protein RarD [Mycoplana dimorpha]